MKIAARQYNLTGGQEGFVKVAVATDSVNLARLELMTPVTSRSSQVIHSQDGVRLHWFISPAYGFHVISAYRSELEKRVSVVCEREVLEEALGDSYESVS